MELPEVLDLLVVGGGPAGTATAFRARELGLSVLVIDYDDLMKRIRDYAKEKLILAHFGGGDQMQFPAGGPLVAALSARQLYRGLARLKWPRIEGGEACCGDWRVWCRCTPGSWFSTAIPSGRYARSGTR